MAKVLFIHPDLGIGGAERLVVDAALALKRKGYNPTFLTNHHDPGHCFEETRDGTFQVSVVGDWLPRSIFGRFYAFCAYFRMVYAAFYASFVLAREQKYDVIICDQISVAIPILRFAKNSPKILFYCHFPDQLLSTKGGFLKSIYRLPLDFLEEYTVGLADSVLVNSKFTLRIFHQTFQRLNIVPSVLYPSLDTAFFDTISKANDLKIPVDGIDADAFIFLSINRYERKKNHNLAIESFKLLQNRLSSSEWRKCVLIVIGGYDHRVNENVQHYEELSKIVQDLYIKDKVFLLKSPSDKQKLSLLKQSHCLLYTPENEHFGIVPLEGMYMKLPVIAMNSGGPTETVVNNSTGFLCENDAEVFSNAMLKVFNDQSLRAKMGEMGHSRVVQKFSFEAFADKLDTIVLALTGNKKLQ